MSEVPLYRSQPQRGKETTKVVIPKRQKSALGSAPRVGYEAHTVDTGFGFGFRTMDAVFRANRYGEPGLIPASKLMTVVHLERSTCHAISGRGG